MVKYLNNLDKILGCVIIGVYICILLILPMYVYNERMKTYGEILCLRELEDNEEYFDWMGIEPISENHSVDRILTGIVWRGNILECSYAIIHYRKSDGLVVKQEETYGTIH